MVGNQNSADYSLQNLNRVRIDVRRDLQWSRQNYSGADCYIVTDPITSRNYRVGLAEHSIITLLENGHTIGEALRLSAATLGANGFTEIDAVRMVQWLVEEGLATSMESVSPKNLSERKEQASKRTIDKINLITLRLPLARPDKFYTQLYPVAAPLFGAKFFFVWLIVLMIGGYFVLSEFDRFHADASRLFSPVNLLWLVLIWAVLKLIHESAHALVCKRYGGRVFEIGVFLILFIPLAYVDVSSMWRFRSKWQRMHVAVAGMYIELFVGGVSAIVWYFTDPSTVNYVAHNTVIVATVGSLLFNANALMRFDGYHLLSDFVEIPNLYSKSQAQLLALCKGVLGGHGMRQSLYPGPKPYFVLSYGVLAFSWRLFVMGLLIYLANALFFGFGALLAFVAVIGWFILPLVRGAEFVRSELQTGRVNFAASLKLGVVALFAIVGLFFIPISTSHIAPGYTEYHKPLSVRAAVAGFVRGLQVESLAAVESGEVLLELENLELENELVATNLEIEAIKLRRRAAINSKNLAQDAALKQHLEVIEARRDELLSDVNSLSVTAPRRGTLVSYQLSDLEGQFLTQGAELGLIVDESRKTIRAFIDSRHASTLDNIHGSIKILTESAQVDSFRGEIVRTQPRILDEIDFHGVTAAGGGAMPIVGTVTRDGPLKLLTPVIEIEISIPEERALTLRAGQRVRVQMNSVAVPVGKRLFRYLAGIYGSTAT